MGGRDQSERLVAINRNRWSQSPGTRTEVQRYTTDADRKRLADTAMAKLRDQSKNADYTNTASHLHKQATKTLKLKE